MKKCRISVKKVPYPGGLYRETAIGKPTYELTVNGTKIRAHGPSGLWFRKKEARAVGNKICAG